MSTHREWAELLRAVAEPGAAAGSEDLLRRALVLSRDVAADMVGCSVTTIDGDRYQTPLYSDGVALDLDRAQYESGDGPCMAAAREHRSHYFDALTNSDRFPGFAEAAIARGVRSSISLPLTGPALPSAINLYASSRFAFDAERPRAVADLLARCVSALLTRPHLPEPTAAPVPVARLEAAQARAQLIAEAQEVLMAGRTLTQPEALNLLIRRGRAERRSIFAVAADVIQAGEVQTGGAHAGEGQAGGVQTGGVQTGEAPAGGVGVAP